jgi:hypothetical protein
LRRLIRAYAAFEGLQHVEHFRKIGAELPSQPSQIVVGL